MPTSTENPDDFLDLLFTNDTDADVLVHVLRTGGMRAGNSINLCARQQICLSLQSAATYRYAVEQRRSSQSQIVEIS